MIGKNNVIDDRPLPAAADRLGETMNSGSPQTQKSDFQEVNEDIRQTHKLYHFQNCGTVYMDSLNARGVRMENCGNHVPQFTCSWFFSPSFSHHFCSCLTWPFHIIQITILGFLAMRKFCIRNFIPLPVVCGHLRHLPRNMSNMYSFFRSPERDGLWNSSNRNH